MYHILFIFLLVRMNKIFLFLLDIMTESKTNPKISIVMAYYNRYPQLITTLDSIQKSSYQNIEVIIVNDCSTDSSPIDSLPTLYEYPIMIVNMDPNKKTYTNSCVPYNVGLNLARGDITIIQNPEVCHVGDVLRYTAENLGPNDYFSYACAAIPSYEVNNIVKTLLMEDNRRDSCEDYSLGLSYDEILDVVKSHSNHPNFSHLNVSTNNPQIVWYNNPSWPNYFHFCAATFTSNIRKMRGFSLEYQNGRCFDDDDLVFKARDVLGLNMITPSIDKCFVFHLYHPPSPAVNCLDFPVDNPVRIGFIRNQKIMERKKRILASQPLRNSIPKIFHAYWDGSPMSLLNYLTVRTFHYYNPEYDIIIWTPSNRYAEISWKEGAHRTPYTGFDYWPMLQEESFVQIKPIDIEEIGFRNDVSEVFKSDYLRWYLLSKYGGLWSDMDIFYIRPVNSIEPDTDFDTLFVCAENYYQNKNGKLEIIDKPIECESNNLPSDIIVAKYFTIAFLMANENNPLFTDVLHASNECFDPNRYQSLGMELFAKKYGTVDNLIDTYPQLRISPQTGDLYLPIQWYELHKLYEESFETSVKNIPSKSIGIHLFGASEPYKKYCNDPDNLNNNSLMSHLIRKFLIIEKNHGLDKYIVNLIESDDNLIN